MFWLGLFEGWLMLSVRLICIQWMTLHVLLSLICWLAIHPLDSVIHPLFNWALVWQTFPNNVKFSHQLYPRGKWTLSSLSYMCFQGRAGWFRSRAYSFCLGWEGIAIRGKSSDSKYRNYELKLSMNIEMVYNLNLDQIFLLHVSQKFKENRWEWQRCLYSLWE